jgi:hypothetical protein
MKSHSSAGSLVPLVLTVAVVAAAAQQAPPPPSAPRLVCPRLHARFGERPQSHPMRRTLQGFLG